MANSIPNINLTLLVNASGDATLTTGNTVYYNYSIAGSITINNQTTQTLSEFELKLYKKTTEGGKVTHALLGKANITGSISANSTSELTIRGSIDLTEEIGTSSSDKYSIAVLFKQGVTQNGAGYVDYFGSDLVNSGIGQTDPTNFGEL